MFLLFPMWLVLSVLCGVNYLDVFEAIKNRRSVRKFKSEDLSEQQIERLITAAQLAPSGCNVQPWRFLVVKDKQLKQKLCIAAYNQKFVEDAPVVMVCCGDLLSWKNTQKQTQDLLTSKDSNVNQQTQDALMNRVNKAVQATMQERIPTTLLNVAIAIEHMVLQAVELGLGSCWVRLFDETQVKQILNLQENLCVVALLPIGVPDEKPAPRTRLPVSKLVLP